MHLETLKMFCDLAELQSFSKTADKSNWLNWSLRTNANSSIEGKGLSNSQRQARCFTAPLGT
jgi:hypothetical protein